MEQIEYKEYEGRGVAAVGCQLDHAEGGDAVGANATQLAVQIGLARAERRYGGGNRRVFMRPVEPGAREQLDRAAACMR